MIAGIFHKGSGLGNQLHRYVATRVLATDKGFDFGMVAPDNFKGRSFMKLDMGIETTLAYTTEDGTGKVIPIMTNPKGMKPTLWEEKTSYYNPEFNFVHDFTIIDGEFQSEQYFGHRMKEIDEWLKVEPIDIPDDVCVIGFRGGEFAVFPELFLTPDYWAEGIKKMLEINPNMKFEVHTDDEKLAKVYWPDFKVIHDIGVNWRSMRYAKYAIIANSSFYILPRLLKRASEKWRRLDFNKNDRREKKSIITIAPRYWARRNTGEWSRPDNFYRAFQYI